MMMTIVNPLPETGFWKHSTHCQFCFQLSSHVGLVYQSICSRIVADQLYSNWITEKKSGQAEKSDPAMS